MIAAFLPAAFPPGLWDGICSGNTCTISSAQDILVIVANAIRIATAFAGALAVIFVVVGGIFYVMSSGDPGRVRRAKDIITNSIIGLVIAALAYTIVSFLAGNF
jgi:hypothetical protein